MIHAHTRLTRVAEGQNGVFTRKQAMEAGLSEHQVDKGVASGRYVRIYDGVYAYAGAPRTDALYQAAACEWAGPEAALSHRTALAEYGLIHFVPDEIELTTVKRRCHDAPVIVHRTNYLPPHHVVRRRCLPFTDIDRTLFDAERRCSRTAESRYAGR